jgi:flagellar motility protein MotE (MotC chaperone)
MISRFCLLSMVSIMAFTSANAQQQAQPDRKDYIITSLQTQRNDAMDREAVCRSDSTAALDALRKEVADLKEKLATAEKK